jgi:ferredoxin
LQLDACSGCGSKGIGQTCVSVTQQRDACCCSLRLPVGHSLVIHDVHFVGLDLPHDCKLGVCMTCPAKLVSGKVDQSGSMLTDDVAAKGYALLCVAVPSTDCKIMTISEVRWRHRWTDYLNMLTTCSVTRVLARKTPRARRTSCWSSSLACRTYNPFLRCAGSPSCVTTPVTSLVAVAMSSHLHTTTFVSLLHTSRDKLPTQRTGHRIEIEPSGASQRFPAAATPQLLTCWIGKPWASRPWVAEHRGRRTARDAGARRWRGVHTCAHITMAWHSSSRANTCNFPGT